MALNIDLNKAEKWWFCVSIILEVLTHYYFIIYVVISFIFIEGSLVFNKEFDKVKEFFIIFY